MGSNNHDVLEDYLVITDAETIHTCVAKYDSLQKDLAHAEGWSLEHFLERAFGKDRLAYRVGGTMIKTIEEAMGRKEVSKAFYLDPDTFTEKYDSVLDEYR